MDATDAPLYRETGISVTSSIAKSLASQLCTSGIFIGLGKRHHNARQLATGVPTINLEDAIAEVATHELAHADRQASDGRIKTK